MRQTIRSHSCSRLPVELESSSYSSEKKTFKHALCRDTVKVAVFDPQEMRGAVRDQRRDLCLLLSLHQDGHEMVNGVHVHVAHVVAANQHLCFEGTGTES